jgi:excisionase family DNA binding protein
MSADLLDALEPVAPSEGDQKLASESVHRLAKVARKGRTLRLTPEGQEPVELPPAAVQLLMRLLSEMAQGHALTLIPFHAELTTQNAADLLGVSRPFIVKQVEDGKLSHHMVGTHRRIYFKDLMDYKRQMEKSRHSALDELAAESQRLNLE